jgi:hypothetical protein
MKYIGSIENGCFTPVEWTPEQQLQFLRSLGCVGKQYILEIYLDGESISTSDTEFRKARRKLIGIVICNSALILSLLYLWMTAK